MSEYPIYLEPDEWEEKLDGMNENDVWEMLRFLRAEGIITWNEKLFEDYGTLAVGPAGPDKNDS